MLFVVIFLPNTIVMGMFELTMNSLITYKISLADDLTQVKIWFQNRRTKWKKQENITNEQVTTMR